MPEETGKKEGIVFDIQTYAIHDGPGIRTCVYFKGCPLHCYWCHNPESQGFAPEMIYRTERCEHCLECVAACPNEALSATRKSIDRDSALCSACGKCAAACPNDAMQTIGYRVTAREVALRAMHDREFFEDSGGGVTLTGGEPSAQPDFLVAVLRELHAAGVHTALETCGFFRPELVDDLVDTVDLFLFDIKHISSEAHEKATGVGNDRILANYREILDRVGQARMLPRIPVVPGFNADRRAVESLASFLSDTVRNGRVELMPYHGLAKDKYRLTGREENRRESRVPTTKEREMIDSIFLAHELQPVWN